MKYMEIKMEDVIISNYSVDSGGDAQPDGGDTFDFQPEFTTEPTASEDGLGRFETVMTTKIDWTGPYADGGFIILG